MGTISIRVYAKSIRNKLALQNEACYVKIRAEQRAGELIAEIPRKQGKAGADGLRTTLVQSDIAPMTANRWEKMSAVSAERVAELAKQHTEAGTELTSIEVYRLAVGMLHVAATLAQLAQVERWGPGRTSVPPKRASGLPGAAVAPA